MDDEFEQKTSSVGRVHPFMEAKIVDSKENILPRNTPGELWTKGYSLMKGYWEDETKSKECITQDGWMKTGDIGIINEDGYLAIDGRIKDMIIRGGENISPKELEEFYLQHDQIFDAQVVSIPDERLGEEICLCITVP
jgi:fatty-acyl-CoA synthase